MVWLNQLLADLPQYTIPRVTQPLQRLVMGSVVDGLLKDGLLVSTEALLEAGDQPQ